MKIKARIFPAVIVVLLPFLSDSLLEAASARQGKPGEKSKQESKSDERIFIPKEVKAVIQEGLASRQGRQDIPFSLLEYLYFPARENLHTIFIFRAKNADLGFVPAVVPQASPAPADGTQKSGQDQAPPAAQAPAASSLLQAKIDVFLQFHQLQNGSPVKIVKEVYIPVVLEADGSSYDPEKLEWYSTAFPFPPGDYLLAMAIAPPDPAFGKIGVSYMEFSLPDAQALGERLDMTPIVFIKQMDRMESPEMQSEVHKGYFTYSVLRVVPNMESVILPGETVEVFYFVFGCQPVTGQKYDIEASYEVRKDDQAKIRWENQAYDFALISQPLPMKQTLLIKDDKGDRQEAHDLEAGTYSLIIKLKDKVSGKTAEKTVGFEVK